MKRNLKIIEVTLKIRGTLRESIMQDDKRILKQLKH